MVIGVISVLEPQEDAPSGDLNYADYGAQHGLQVHLLVETPQNDSDHHQHDGGDGEGEGHDLGCLAELLVVLLLRCARQKVIGNHQTIRTTAETQVFVEVVTSRADRTQEIDLVADVAVGKTACAYRAIGNHVHGTTAETLVLQQVIASLASETVVLAVAGGASRGTGCAGSTRRVESWRAGHAVPVEELSVGAGETGIEGAG